MSTPTIIEYLSEQLEQTRENHPSFKLMNNKIDESLFPEGIITFQAQAMNSNEELKTVKEIVEDSWNKGKKNHLMIEGEGGIGKTVTLLSLPDKIAPHPVPAIYIPLHDIRGTGDEDLIERYIKIEVLEEDEELFRQLKKLRRTKWEKGPVLLLLLDGFNELPSEVLRGSVSRDIERWANYPGVQIITSSRYDIHNYVSLQSDFSKIELQRISNEKVRDYLDRVDMPIPTDAALLELITNPLLLTLYIKTEIIRSQRASSFARFRDTKNAGTLIWNYLQCELWRFRNDRIVDVKPSILAMEFIAPYIAWKMQQQSCFSLNESSFNELLTEAHALLEAHIANPSELPSHISIILQQSNELPPISHLSLLLKEHLGIFVGFKEKDGNGNDVVRYKLMHQQFRDALAAMHLINLSYLSGNYLPQEWNTPIDYYVMQFVVDLTSEKEAMRLWEQNRSTKPAFENATRNQLRLQGLLHDNDFSELDFSGLDLSNISLYPFRINKTKINLPTQPERLYKTKLSDKTFSPEGHESSVVAVAVTPKGEQIVSGDVDGTIYIWDLETRNSLGHLITGHEHWGYRYIFSLTPNSKRIASISEYPESIQVWDLETGNPIGNSIRYNGPMDAVTMTPDGNRIISEYYDGTLRIWDIGTGNPVGNPIEGHKDGVCAIAVTPDGKRIISEYYDGTIRVWDIGTGNPVGNPIEGHEDEVCAVAVTPDGKRIVSGSLDNTIRVWDLEAGNPVGNPIEGHEDGVCALAVTPDGKRIVSGSIDNTIRIWDMETGDPIGNPIEGHEDVVCAVAVTPDGKRIVSGSKDNTIRVWDLETGNPIGKPIKNPIVEIYDAVVTPNGKHVVFGLEDGTIRVWDLNTGSQSKYPIEGHDDSINSVAVTPDGKYIISGSKDETIRVWKLETGISEGNPIETSEGEVETVAVTQDGKRIVSWYEYGAKLTWDLETGIQNWDPVEWLDIMDDGAAMTPKGEHISIWYNYDLIRFTNIETKETRTIKILPLSFVGLDFSKADISNPKLKETLRQNGAIV